MINTLSVVFVILPFANVFVPCPFTFGTIGMGAVSVAFIVLEFTNVFVPTGIGIGAMSVLFAVLPFANVTVTFGMGIGAVSIHFAVLEFTNVLVPIAPPLETVKAPKQSVQGIETTADTDCFLVKEILEGVSLPKEPRPGYQVSPLLEHVFV